MYNNNRINKFFIQLKINEEVSPGIEPGSEDSKSSMLTDYTTRPEGIPQSTSGVEPDN